MAMEGSKRHPSFFKKLLGDFTHKIAIVCLHCGDTGFDETLIYCNNCNEYAVHRYCLETVIFHGDVLWFCEDCQPEIGKPDTNGEGCTPTGRKKKRRTKNQKWTRVKNGRKKKMLKPRA